MELLPCRKCNGENFELREKGTQTGLYCTDCGAWIKWVPKKDIPAIKAMIERQRKNNSIPPVLEEDKDFAIKLEELIAEYEGKGYTETVEEEHFLEQFYEWVKNK